jgi:hypothetical protein
MYHRLRRVRISLNQGLENYTARSSIHTLLKHGPALICNLSYYLYSTFRESTTVGKIDKLYKHGNVNLKIEVPICLRPRILMYLQMCDVCKNGVGHIPESAGSVS